MNHIEINKGLSAYIHNEDFPYYLERLSSDDLGKEEEKFIKREIFNIPFLDILIINTKFSKFIEDLRREYKINKGQSEEWRGYESYEKQYPKVIKRINEFLNKEFPKLNGLAPIFVTQYLFEDDLSSIGIEEVLSRDPMITRKKYIDPITKKCDIIISYTIEGNTSPSIIGINKELKELNLPEDYFKKYKKPSYRTIGQRYLLYILKNKLNLKSGEIEKWFSKSNIPYSPTDEAHYSESFKLLLNSFC